MTFSHKRFTDSQPAFTRVDWFNKRSISSYRGYTYFSSRGRVDKVGDSSAHKRRSLIYGTNNNTISYTYIHIFYLLFSICGRIIYPVYIPTLSLLYLEYFLYMLHMAVIML